MLSLHLMEERDCATCTAIKKRDWGCDAPAPRPSILDGQELWRCPRRPLLDDSGLYSDLFWLYKQFVNGYLPEAGGLLDQPNKLMEYFRIIAAAAADGEKAKEEQHQKRQRKLAQVSKVR